MIMPVLQKQLQSVLQLITCQVSEWMAWIVEVYKAAQEAVERAKW